MARSAYSALTYVLLLVAVAPLALAVSLSALLDWYPWFLLLAMGLGLAWAGRRLLGAAQAALSRRLAALVQGEAAQAPGAWFVWIAVPAWTMGLGVILNVALDRSPPEDHGSVVLRVSGGKSPRVYLRDYRIADGAISFRRSRAPISGLRLGQSVTLIIRRGLFGWPFLAALR